MAIRFSMSMKAANCLFSPVVHCGGIDFGDWRQVKDDPLQLLASLIRPLCRLHLVLVQRLPHRLWETSKHSAQMEAFEANCGMFRTTSDYPPFKHINLSTVFRATNVPVKDEALRQATVMLTGTLA